MYRVRSIEGWFLQVPLATPYHLSRVMGTLTHSDAIVLRVTLDDGTAGWGESDPGGVNFDGVTGESVFAAVAEKSTSLLGTDVSEWVQGQRGRGGNGALDAAFDVAFHDALARADGKPLWQLLGSQQRDRIDVLWPTSSGSVAEDLAVIRQRHKEGFRTYMLKMGDRPAADDLARLESVLAELPKDVRIMVDANQGWTREEGIAFGRGAKDLPVVLIEQPVAMDDLAGLKQVRDTGCIVSVDESIQHPDDLQRIIDAHAADIFSVKISKNGGLANSAWIAAEAGRNEKRVLMNSMIELGITQAASLHLGCTLHNLVDCGHAYMSTLRMSDDITDFSGWVTDGVAVLPDRPGLGVAVDEDRIDRYRQGEFHVSR
jgi:muconate cycloisomerase